MISWETCPTDRIRLGFIVRRPGRQPTPSTFSGPAMDNGPSENPHTDTMITNMDNGDGGAVSTGEAADAGDAGNRREEPDATRDSETEPAARVETVSRPRTPMGASETAAPARAKEKAVHFSGRVLRFATVGLSEAELAAAAASDGAPKMPTQTQCQVAFGEPHVITEVRLVPKGLKPMQNLAPEQEHWIGNTVPGTFDLTVFYATPVPKGEAPAEGPRPQKWESLNKKMLKYNEKNRVQSLYTWKFTGQNVPVGCNGSDRN